MTAVDVTVTVNGVQFVRRVEPRRLLTDFLRDDLGLTGTHVGCEHGVCGACNVVVDGELVRGCLMLAAQVDGTELTTIEGLTRPDGALHPVQQALVEEHGFQCGFCTPGVALALAELVERGVPETDDELREELAGNLCRCTGYVGIVAAARRAAQLASEER
jgi:carbon-monoxide dehydrogenase small subunit